MRVGCPAWALADIVLGVKSWKKDRSPVGRSWQASRIDGSAVPTRASTKPSRCEGSGRLLIPDHANPAGRAAGSPATDARMRHIVAQAGFQHAQAFGHAQGPAVAIPQGNHAAAPLVQFARAPCEQGKPD